MGQRATPISLRTGFFRNLWQSKWFLEKGVFLFSSCFNYDVLIRRYLTGYFFLKKIRFLSDIIIESFNQTLVIRVFFVDFFGFKKYLNLNILKALIFKIVPWVTSISFILVERKGFALLMDPKILTNIIKNGLKRRTSINRIIQKLFLFLFGNRRYVQRKFNKQYNSYHLGHFLRNDLYTGEHFNKLNVSLLDKLGLVLNNKPKSLISILYKNLAFFSFLKIKQLIFCFFNSFCLKNHLFLCNTSLIVNYFIILDIQLKLNLLFKMMHFKLYCNFLGTNTFLYFLKNTKNYHYFLINFCIYFFEFIFFKLVLKKLFLNKSRSLYICNTSKVNFSYNLFKNLRLILLFNLPKLQPFYFSNFVKTDLYLIIFINPFCFKHKIKKDIIAINYIHVWYKFFFQFFIIFVNNWLIKDHYFFFFKNISFFFRLFLIYNFYN